MTILQTWTQRFEINYIQWQRHNDRKGDERAAKWYWEQMQVCKSKINQTIISTNKQNLN